MFDLAAPLWEFIVRGSVIYLFLLLLLRLGGKRQVGQLTPLDLVLLLIISNAIQNAMIGKDTSLIGGIIVVITLTLWDQGLGWLGRRSPRVARAIEGRAEILVHHGQVYEDVLRRQQMTRDDLDSALRRAGCFDLVEVELAVLEPNGAVTVKRRDPDSHTPPAEPPSVA
jgi:uncharacterized membrane protein YcaP (DUF421 family)